MKKNTRHKALLIVLIIILVLSCLPMTSCRHADAQSVLETCLGYFSASQYARAYKYLSEAALSRLNVSEFSKRYTDPYEAMGLTALSYSISPGEIQSQSATNYALSCTMQTTRFGTLSFDMSAAMVKEGGEWKLNWSPALVLPSLSWENEARVYTISGKRGEIFDTNGKPLAINSVAATVYVDTSEVVDFENLVRLLAPVLHMTEAQIRTKLKDYVYTYSYTDDAEASAEPTPTPTPTAEPQGFLEKLFSKPIATPEATEPPTEDEERRSRVITIKTCPLSEMTDALQAELESINGVGVDKKYMTRIRYYPYGNVLSQVLGYTSVITAEDIASGKYDGYAKDSLIGKLGLEASYESYLKADPGYELVITDSEGNRTETLASTPAVDGFDLRLSIDIDMQLVAEALLRDNLTSSMAGCAIVMDPLTGYVQALANLPGFDPNIFSYTISDSLWQSMQSDEGQHPFLNRATLGQYPPGSTFKPFTAIDGLASGAITTAFEFTGKIVNNIWKPDDSSWTYPGIKRVTATPAPLNLYNAMTYSDNIYFAYTALQIGSTELIRFCKSIGLTQEMHTDLPIAMSRIANSEDITSSRQLADTGYGQGEMLISPLQMTALFSSLRNGGDIMLPRIVKSVERYEGAKLYTEVSHEAEVWIDSALDADALSTIRPMLRNVVKNGTGKKIDINGLGICGKTGTAQVGNSGEDEIAWFLGYTTEKYERLVCVTIEVPSNEGAARYEVAKGLFKYEALSPQSAE